MLVTVFFLMNPSWQTIHALSNILPAVSGVEALRVEFDRRCSTERRHDPLTIMDGTGRTVAVRSGLSVVNLIRGIFTTLQTNTESGIR